MDLTEQKELNTMMTGYTFQVSSLTNSCEES